MMRISMFELGGVMMLLGAAVGILLTILTSVSVNMMSIVEDVGAGAPPKQSRFLRYLIVACFVLMSIALIVADVGAVLSFLGYILTGAYWLEIAFLGLVLVTVICLTALLFKSMIPGKIIKPLLDNNYTTNPSF